MHTDLTAEHAEKAEWHDVDQVRGILERFRPPYDLTADMLLVAALAPAAPLRRAFPAVPFLDVLGQTPLVCWFSQVTAGCYFDGAGERRCEERGGQALYYELNVVAMLRARAFFVPGIYVTHPRTMRIAWHYGMPKQVAPMRMQVQRGWITSRVQVGRRCAHVRARRLGSGQALAWLLDRLWPLRMWPAHFPAPGSVRATLLATRRVYPAYIADGELALDATWLPRAVRLLPLGLYLPGLRMRLPPPGMLHRRGAEGAEFLRISE